MGRGVSTVKIAAVVVTILIVVWRVYPKREIVVPPSPELIVEHVTVLESGETLSWQDPRTNEKGFLRGVLLAFHGCSRAGSDWFNLPEERAMVRQALKEGMFVVAPTAISTSRCWDDAWPAETNQDILRLKNVLEWVYAEHRLSPEVPVFAIGASSGGTFVSIVMHAVRCSIVEVMISPGAYVAMDTPLPYEDVLVAFVYMTRDKVWASAENAKESASRIEKHGVRGVSTIVYAAPPLFVSPEFLSNRIDGLNVNASASFFQALSSNGLIDRASGQLVHHVSLGEQRKLRETISFEPARQALEEHERAVDDEMQTAWGEHSMTRVHFPELLARFISKHPQIL